VSFALLWAILGLALVLSEFLIPGFVIFFFGAGALVNALLVGLIPGLRDSLPLQLIIWLGTSGLSLAVLRRYFARWFRGSTIDPADDSAYLGKQVKVLEPIDPENPGRVRFQGVSWEARSYDEAFTPGDRVEIIKKEGMSFIVTRSISGDDYEALE
jgi:membrane protein implicated in regulation of membrane protease activity